MRSICPGASMQVNGAVGTPRYASVSLVRPLCSDSASVSGSEPVYGMFRYSQIAGTSASRLWPWSPSAMLKTRSGRARTRFCGKNWSASSRMTLPKRPRACSTAAMVDGSSHSANASLALSDAASGAGSGFSLYARPMRMWSRVTSYKKGRSCGLWIETRCRVENKEHRSDAQQATRKFFRRRRASDFVVRDAGGVVLVVGEINLEIGEHRRRLARQDAKTRDRHPSDLELRALAGAQLEHRPPRTRVGRHDDLHLGGVGKDAARRLARHLAAVHLVCDPHIALHQRLDGAHVRRLSVRHLSLPLGFECRVPQHRGRHDERGMRFVDVTLRQLRIAEPRTVSHQLVRAGARDSFDQEHVDRMLQHRTVALLLDVLEVLGRGPVSGVVLAHVADPAGEFGEALAGGGGALPLHPQVLGLEELRSGDQRDARSAEDFHGGEGLGVRGSGSRGQALGSPSRRSAPPLAAGPQCRRGSAPPRARP